MRELGHEPSRAPAGIERELHVPEPRAPLRALAAQRFQPAHAAFIPRPARLDPLADPGFLLRPEPVELALRDGFGHELPRLARFVGTEVAGIRTQETAVQLDNACGHAI